MNKKSLLGLVISLACLGWVLRQLDWAQLGQSLVHINPLYVVAVVALVLFSLWVRSWRWQRLLRPVGSASVSCLWGATLIGYMATILLPARLGEVVKVYAARRLSCLPLGGVTGSVVAERVLDSATLCLMIFPPLWMMDPTAQAGAFNQAYLQATALTMLILALGALGVVVILTRWPGPAIRLAGGLARRFAPRLEDRLRAGLTSFAQGLAAVRGPRELLLMLAWSFLVWLPIYLSNVVFLPALGLPMSFRLGALALAGGVLAAAVPAGPGFLGTFQLSVYWCLQLGGAEPQAAMAFAIVFWVVSMSPMLVGGLVEMYRHGLRLGTLRQPAEAGSPTPSAAPAADSGV